MAGKVVWEVPSCHFIFLSQETATGYPGQANGLSPKTACAPHPLKASPPQNRLGPCVAQADPISPVWAEGKAHPLLSLSLVPLSPYETSMEPAHWPLSYPLPLSTAPASWAQTTSALQDMASQTPEAPLNQNGVLLVGPVMLSSDAQT